MDGAESLRTGVQARLAAVGHRRWIGIIVGAGVLFRVAAAIGHSFALTSDFAEYDHLAMNIVTRWSYGDNPYHAGIGIPPGWPATLAVAYKIFGHHAVVGRLLGAALESAALVCASLVATKVLRPKLAVLAVGILALHPVWIFWSTALASEHLGLFLVTAALAIFVRTRLSRLGIVTLGLLVAGLDLNRPEVALCLVLGLVVGFVTRYGYRRAALVTVGMLATTAIALTPWIVRNEVRFHEFVPASTNGGVNFYLGTLSPYYTFPYQRSGLVGNRGEPPTTYGPKAVDDWYYHAGFENVKARPLTWLRYDVIRLREMFFYDDIPAYDAEVGQLAWPHKRGLPNLPLEDYWHPLNTLWRLFMVFAIAGAVVVVRRWRRIDPIWHVIVVFLVTSAIVKMPFPGDSRQHMTLTTSIILLGGVGAQSLWDWWQRRRGDPVPAAS